MKWFCFSLVLFLSSLASGQEKRDSTFFPDTLYAVGTSSYFQREDIYSFLTFQLPIVKNLLIEAGFGWGWRQARTNSIINLNLQFGFHYDFLKHPKFNLGPSLRMYYQGADRRKSEVVKFTYYGANLGYRFAYGGKLKIVQASYAGPHQMWYNISSNSGRVVYFGYAFQLGLNYEL